MKTTLAVLPGCPLSGKSGKHLLVLSFSQLDPGADIGLTSSEGN
jgi:hypothetical protein